MMENALGIFVVQNWNTQHSLWLEFSGEIGILGIWKMNPIPRTKIYWRKPRCWGIAWMIDLFLKVCWFDSSQNDRRRFQNCDLLLAGIGWNFDLNSFYRGAFWYLKTMKLNPKLEKCIQCHSVQQWPKLPCQGMKWAFDKMKWRLQDSECHAIDGDRQEVD